MYSNSLKLAVNDIYLGFLNYHIWYFLAWQDIKQRYRRSIIGPFWITISTGIMVMAMGPLYGALLKQDIGPYIQHLAISMIIWTFLSGFINESCSAFISAEGYIKEIKQPLAVYLLRTLTRNVLYFLHNLVIILIVLFFYPPTQLTMLLQIPLGIVLVFGNLYWIGLLLAILCARFRDIPQVVTSFMQVLFFVSPIIWKVDMLGRNRLAADVNPFFHLMELIRTPLLGGQISALSWGVSSVMMFGGGVVTLIVFSRFRSRVPYWL
jgi:lipopolysaccharide transport system permease protein